MNVCRLVGWIAWTKNRSCDMLSAEATQMTVTAASAGPPDNTASLLSRELPLSTLWLLGCDGVLLCMLTN